MSPKPAIRVRTADGKAREWKSLHQALGAQTYVRIHAQRGNIEFILTVDSPRQLDPLRAKLAHAGVVEMVGGNTNVVIATEPDRSGTSRLNSNRHEDDRHRQRTAPANDMQQLRKKPYGFVSLPDQFETSAPVWHDGTCSAGRLAGEIRLELKALTPLLVGWERATSQVADAPESSQGLRGTVKFFKDDKGFGFIQRDDGQDDLFVHFRSIVGGQQILRKGQRVTFKAVSGRKGQEASDVRILDDVVAQSQGDPWLPPAKIDGVLALPDKKPVLCPLRAPWGSRPVILPGDSLKGFLRHELGALLGAPMERVAERSYSYRPNSKFPYDQKKSRFAVRLEPRLARVLRFQELQSEGKIWRVPLEVAILDLALRDQQTYYPHRLNNGQIIHNQHAAPYNGGMGGGQRLPPEILNGPAASVRIHTNIDARVGTAISSQKVPDPVCQQYLATLRHLRDPESGHFSARYQSIGKDKNKREAAIKAVTHAAERAFNVGDMIWVELDKDENKIVSFGWHYYYRWAYVDTVRKRGNGIHQRHGLFPHEDEKVADDSGAPSRLTAARRLFGYALDKNNEGIAGLGCKDDHEQLMGRVSINAALEVVSEGERDEDRFLPPVFLKELGIPRPSAVEHSLKQPHYQNHRPWDQAHLLTYGDAAGYDNSGEIAGRKFYLDRMDAYDGVGNALVPGPAADEIANRANERSTLALEASRPGRRFRCALRFRDLDPAELAAILVALCPDQFKATLGGAHKDGYCSKLGYARPLGWGTVRFQANQLLLLKERPAETTDSKYCELDLVADLGAFVQQHWASAQVSPALQQEWLDIHRHRHPESGDYPRENGKIYTFYTNSRANHSQLRRYRP